MSCVGGRAGILIAVDFAQRTWRQFLNEADAPLVDWLLDSRDLVSLCWCVYDILTTSAVVGAAVDAVNEFRETGARNGGSMFSDNRCGAEEDDALLGVAFTDGRATASRRDGALGHFVGMGIERESRIMGFSSRQ